MPSDKKKSRQSKSERSDESYNFDMESAKEFVPSEGNIILLILILFGRQQ